jgi:hypothetical protein
MKLFSELIKFTSLAVIIKTFFEFSGYTLYLDLLIFYLILFNY